MHPAMRAGAMVVIALVACGGTEPNAARRKAARAPAPAARPAPAPSSSTRVDDPEVVVGRMRQSFRECYQIGLWNNANQRGSIRLVLKIDARGRPSSVTTVGGAGLDRMVVDCLVGVARRGTFAPSSGREGPIEIPIAFTSDTGVTDAGASSDPLPPKRDARD